MTGYHLDYLLSCWEEGVVVNEREGMTPVISNPIPEHLEYFHVFVLLFVHLFLEKGPCLAILVRWWRRVWESYSVHIGA